jgi:lipopolysaccharide transport system ATP-binding protein
MSDTVIKVEDLGKLYRLGEVGTGTISHDLNRWWAKVRGKEDPLSIIGEINDRTQKGNSDYVWALKDINFELKQGEVLGIIGRNGAGKSTLLKLLSKVTTPSKGYIKIKGRIASLLEVGTGFHPELTGRENIFLNGAILGMTKAEIRSKFDEIVDFSGVERYIDTPVKRYSSGMYVRLAFAVAAFLEPEILIIDEVLAVGDAEFQKKCLGRMKDVSTIDGRTILFVSHNLGAVRNLCDNVIILKNGGLVYQGEMNRGIKLYLDSNNNNSSSVYRRPNNKMGVSYFDAIEIVDSSGNIKEEFSFDEEINIMSKVYMAEKHLSSKVGFKVFDNIDRCVFTSEVDIKSFTNRGGEIELLTKIPSNLLVPNSYKIHFSIHIPNIEFIESLPDVVQFNVIETGTDFFQYSNTDVGCVFVNCKWQALHV